MKALKLTALFAFAAFAFVSCSKNDSSPAAPTYAGSATYEGNTYRTDSAYFAAGYDSTNQIDVGYFFLSSNLSSYFSTTGTGNTIILEYLQKTIVPGSYTFQNSGQVSITKNFVAGEVLLDANTSKELYVEVISPSTLTVSKVDDTRFKFDYDLTLSNNKKITGSYTGVVRQ